MKDKEGNKMPLILILGIILLSIPTYSIAQDFRYLSYSNLEKYEDTNEDLFQQIYAIVKKYPEFSYEYKYRSGKVAGVDITGVPDESDKNKLKSMIYSWKLNRGKILNLPNRTGVYYDAEEKAKPVGDYKDFHQKFIGKISYPDNARSAGVGGMVYLKFVVDDDGSIHHLTASADIKSPHQDLVNELIEETKKAFRETNLKWDPATVDGIPVSSYVVLPISFNFNKNPTFPILLR